MTGTKGQEAREKMGEDRNNRKGLRRVVLFAFAIFATMLMLAPAGAQARKIDNPSPPDFFGEVSGGFLQFVGNGGQILQLSLDFESQGLSKPSFRGTVNSSGDIFVPQAQVVFPPLALDLDGDTVNVALLPTAPATGRIDPLSGRVDFRVRLRIQLSGAAAGVSLGGNCFIGNAANPIDIDSTTHYGTFPDTALGTYVASFLPDGGSFPGGWQPAGPYSDEIGLWPLGPKFMPDFPIDATTNRPPPAGQANPNAPAADLIPYSDSELFPRTAGSWRGQNETLRAIGASGCGPLNLADGTINGELGLPSVSGDSTASLDFTFVAGGARVGPNAIVQKGVKSNFNIPGVSSPTWPSTEVPELPTTVGASLNASSSLFTAGPNPGGRYRFDLGTGTFGPWTDDAVQPIVFATAGLRTFRVQTRDADGDIDTKTRRLLVVPSTDIAVTNSAPGGSFRGGSNGTIRYDVSNVGGTRANTQPIVLTSDIPAGTSFVSASAPSGWVCGFSAPTVTCSLPSGQLDGSSTESIDVTVAVDPTAATPLSNSANVSQAGDPNPANNNSTASIPVRKTDLTVSISHTGDVVANGTFAHDIAVQNIGDGETVGNTVVNVTLPSELTFRATGSGGSGFNCVASPTPQDVVCTRTSSIPGNTSLSPFPVRAKVVPTASGSYTTNATVSAQGDTNAFGGNNAASDDINVLVRPDLALNSSVSGDFVVGDPGELTLTATNESVLPITGPTTIASSLPDGITVDGTSGSGWDCSATASGSDELSCEFGAGLAAGSSAPDLVVELAVDHGSYPSTQIDSQLENAADGYAGNNAASSSVPVRRLDVNINKSAVRSFAVGIEGQYRLSVTNVGDAATVGPIEVRDELPAEIRLAGASGGGWDCTASTPGGQSVTCVSNSSIVPDSSAPNINVRVNVLDAAGDSGEVINTATVDTPRDERDVAADDPVNGNNSSTISTKAVSVDLSVESTHGADFRTGTTQEYSLKIRNVGFFGTVAGAPVTVEDDLPAGMVPQMANIWTDRAGWVCTDENEGTSAAPDHTVTCELPAPGPASSAVVKGATATIEIPVSVRDNAVDPSLNVAEVSTEKDNSVDRSPNNRSEDPTTVTRIDLATSASQSIAPRAGSIGETSVDVTNNGTNATVQPTVVTIPLASSTSYRPTGSTIAGWQCSSAGSGSSVICTRLASIPAGGSAPPLKVRTNVGPSAPATWNTAVTVRTDGELAERLGDNDVTLSQTLERIDLRMIKTVVPGAIKAGTRGQYTLSVENIGNTASTGTTTVTESVHPTFTGVTAEGPGWSCQVNGQDLTCTRTSSVPAGSTTPVIAVGFDVPSDAAGTRTTTAFLSNPSDPYPSNNSASASVTIVASADAAVSIDQPSAMRVGDLSSITYKIRNVGTEPTSGSPAARLRIEMPDSLEPVSTTSTGAWDCSVAPKSGELNAMFDCVLPTQLNPGDVSTLNAQVRVLPTSDSETGTLARVTTAGDVNRSNDTAFAVSSISGVDLAAAVAPVAGQEDTEADITSRRVVTVSNVGTASTTGPIRVEVPLPGGVSWTSNPPFGTGWECSQPAGSTVICERNDVIAPDSTAPALNIDIRPSRSNAPSVTVDYTVDTTNDENAANDTATRTDIVLFKPTVEITSGPSGTTTSRNATLEFTSDDPAATFECKFDLEPFAACTSPYNLAGLTLGGHSVTVRAVNERGMLSATPAEANWTVIADTPVGNSVPIKGKLTGGELSLAALGAVPLPADQLELEGSLFENGALSIPQAGVKFLPIEQTLDAPGIGTVTVKISISATGPGSGTLPVGGGEASFNLPVQAKLEAALGGIPLIGPDADCFLRPIQFDLSGAYDEAGKTVTFASPSITFPTVSAGCGPLGDTVNDLLELPRSDIAISLDFALEVGSSGAPKLAKLKKSGPKSVKAGKTITLKATVRNSGTALADAIEVCVKSPTRFVTGNANRCTTVRNVAAGKSRTATFKLKTKKGRKGKAEFQISAAVKAQGGSGGGKKQFIGHITLLK
jgi:hypothetical protein